MQHWDWRLYWRGLAGVLVGMLVGAVVALALHADPWTGYTVGAMLAFTIFAVAVYRRRGMLRR